MKGKAITAGESRFSSQSAAFEIELRDASTTARAVGESYMAEDLVRGGGGGGGRMLQVMRGSEMGIQADTLCITIHLELWSV